MKTSLSADSAPTDPDDELLVAYLDGELHRSERTDLENRLLGEPKLRGRLTELQSSWDLLDVLSVDGSGVSLVETTLELAIADVASRSGERKPHPESSHQESSHPGKKPAWRSRRTIGVVAACVLAAVIASLLAVYQSRQSSQSQLRDLAIAQNLDAYNYGGDIGLMRMLAADPDWAQVVAAFAELSPDTTATTSLQQIALTDREAAIGQMSVDERQRLGLRWDKLNRLSEEDKQIIRQRALAVTEQPDASALLETMKSYAIWRDRVPEELLDKIEGDNTAIRRQAIRSAIEESKSSIAKQSGSQLDDESVEVIYFALREFARNRIPDDQRRFFSQNREWFPIRQFFGDSDRDSPGKRSYIKSGRRDASLTQSELSTIESLLPTKSHEMLEMVTDGDAMLTSMTLQIWVEEAIRRKRPRRGDDSLLEKYQKLSGPEREAIDLMPPEKMLENVSEGRGLRP